MSKPRDAELQKAYLEMFDFRGIPTIALTLTFKPNLGKKNLTKKIAEETLRHFLRRLNRMRGRKRKLPRKEPLRTLVVLEGGVGSDCQHLHYHLQVEVPSGFEPEKFAEHCLRTWSRLRWGSDKQTVAKTQADSGWTSYCLKLRTKQDFSDAVDVMNSYIMHREETPTASRAGIQ